MKVIAPSDIAALWTVIAQARQARGDYSGQLSARQSSYTVRLARAVGPSCTNRAARVAAVRPSKALAAHLLAEQLRVNTRPALAETIGVPA